MDGSCTCTKVPSWSGSRRDIRTILSKLIMKKQKFARQLNGNFLNLLEGGCSAPIGAIKTMKKYLSRCFY
jgi:porphobilinogen deaminase